MGKFEGIYLCKVLIFIYDTWHWLLTYFVSSDLLLLDEFWQNCF